MKLTEQSIFNLVIIAYLNKLFLDLRQKNENKNGFGNAVLNSITTSEFYNF